MQEQSCFKELSKRYFKYNWSLQFNVLVLKEKMATIFEGNLTKMGFNNAGTEQHIKPQYYVGGKEARGNLHSLIGHEMEIGFTGQINCMECGKSIKKTYGQGYCYPCFISIPQTEECVMKPELCRAHEGIARDMDYSKIHCLSDQFIYLTLSGGLKVGVTRHSQVPTRWVDQGAVRALKVAVTPNRYQAGLVEVALKNIFADRTNWRKMLTQNDEPIPLLQEKQKALDFLKDQPAEYKVTDDMEYSIDYTIQSFPEKVKSLDFLKIAKHRGVLTGIKGQYLLFKDNTVINIRKHGGFFITIQA